MSSGSADDVHGLARDVCGDIVGNDVHEPLASLQALPSDVRREDDVVEGVQGVVWDGRLGLLHIQAGASDIPGLQDLDEVRLVDQRTATRVDQECRRLHLAQGVLVHDVLRVVVERAMQTHEVARREQLIERNRVRLRAAGRDDDLHPQGYPKLRHLAADVSTACDQAQSLACKLEVGDLHVLREVVLVTTLQHVHLRNQGAAEIQHVRYHELCDGVAGVGRAIADRNALGFGSRQIDVVETGASLLNDFDTIRKAGDDVTRHQNLLEDDDLGTLDTLQDLLRRGIGLEAHELPGGGLQPTEVQALVEVQPASVHEHGFRHCCPWNCGGME
mmetsp:Transcript_62217/g.158203  ORF Transcript_62217/g.158203 Transcript_62217/m.158203 type:complete len:331 (+) Transcript_62217:81-1073(+)